MIMMIANILLYASVSVILLNVLIYVLENNSLLPNSISRLINKYSDEMVWLLVTSIYLAMYLTIFTTAVKVIQNT